MKSKYFCLYHAETIRSCENEALTFWSQMMRRGVKAYVECRLETAMIYLEAAIDLALMRFQCSENDVFSDVHLSKPAEFVIQLHLISDDFESINCLLKQLNCVAKQVRGPRSQFFQDFLLEQYKSVRLAQNNAPKESTLSEISNAYCVPVSAFKTHMHS